MAKIFISYSHKDTTTVELIAPQLDTIYGLGVYWYDTGIRGGADWWEMIKREIENCQIVLFFMSDTSIISKYCMDELREALRFRKSIVPILLPNFKGTYGTSFPSDITDDMNKIQYVNIRGGFNNLSSLWGALNHLFANLRLPLNVTERWILFNQFHLMKNLKLDDDSYDPSYYEKSTEILASGYEWYYDDIANHVFADSFPYGDSLEIVNILDMFRFIGLTYESLVDKTGIEHSFVKFEGFSSSKETAHKQFTEFMIEKMKDFEEQQLADYKSIAPMLNIYRKMMVEWHKSPDRYNLTKNDLVRITNAPTNPASVKTMSNAKNEEEQQQNIVFNSINSLIKIILIFTPIVSAFMLLLLTIFSLFLVKTSADLISETASTITIIFIVISIIVLLATFYLNNTLGIMISSAGRKRKLDNFTPIYFILVTAGFVQTLFWAINKENGNTHEPHTVFILAVAGAFAYFRSQYFKTLENQN